MHHSNSVSIVSPPQPTPLPLQIPFDTYCNIFMDICSQQRQQIQSLQTEIEGYKKSIQKEQENNETLTLMLQKNEIDINSMRKQITTSQTKQEQLKQEYGAYSRMLHETEQNLNRATTVNWEQMLLGIM